MIIRVVKILSAQDWIRTSTSFRTLRPEHSASTNFATWATFLSVSDAANIEKDTLKIYTTFYASCTKTY